MMKKSNEKGFIPTSLMLQIIAAIGSVLLIVGLVLGWQSGIISAIGSTFFNLG